jgi:hypothetical protein
MLPKSSVFALVSVNLTVIGLTTVTEFLLLTAAISVSAAVTPFWSKIRS